MTHINKLEVIDREGWRREFTLQKAVIHLGSDGRNDITLDSTRGGNVSPLHAQLILSAPSGESAITRAQLVNLADTDMPLGSAAGGMLAPRSAADLANGMSFRVGDFTLIFHGAQAAPIPVEERGQNIGLSLQLPRTRLEPRRFLDGVVRVKNGGDKGAAQIELQLEGLPDSCYELEPGPMLSSGADRAVLLRVFHRGHLPVAGVHRLVIRATAPRAYPGDEASCSVKIEVVPHYSFKMCLLPPVKPLPSCVEVFKPGPRPSPVPQAVEEAASAPLALSAPVVPTESVPEAPPVFVPGEMGPEKENEVPTMGRVDWWAPTVVPEGRKTQVPDGESKAPAGQPAALTTTASETVSAREALQPASAAAAERHRAVEEEAPAPAVSTPPAVAPAGDTAPPAQSVVPPISWTEPAIEIPEPAPAIVSPVEQPPQSVAAAVTTRADDESAPAAPAEPEAIIAEPAPLPTAGPRPADKSVTEETPVHLVGAGAWRTEQAPSDVWLPEPVIPHSLVEAPAASVPVTPAKVDVKRREREQRPRRAVGETAPSRTHPEPVESTVDVWWQTPSSQSVRKEQAGKDDTIVRLKAAPPVSSSSQAGWEDGGPAASSWWAPGEEEATIPQPPEEPRSAQTVLKMKAKRPPDRAEVAETSSVPASVSMSEDWWSPADDAQDRNHA